METDLIWMSLVIFIPSVFALGLLFFPRGWEEWMRWWSLFGTALTLGVSIAIFIYFKSDVVDPTVGSGRDEHVADARQSLLARKRRRRGRKSEASMNVPDAVPRELEEIWITRSEWVKRGFNIDYFLGVDGLSLALMLLTTFLCFLAMIASWKIDKFGPAGYCIPRLLVLETGLLGTFQAAGLLPVLRLLGGQCCCRCTSSSASGAVRAANTRPSKFFLYTLLGAAS